MAMETARDPRLRERCRVKHYSLRTEQAYIHWIRRLIVFHGKRHPREMGGPEVERSSVTSRYRRTLRRRPRTRRWRQSFFCIGSRLRRRPSRSI